MYPRNENTSLNIRILSMGNLHSGWKHLLIILLGCVYIPLKFEIIRGHALPRKAIPEMRTPHLPTGYYIPSLMETSPQTDHSILLATTCTPWYIHTCTVINGHHNEVTTQLPWCWTIEGEKQGSFCTYMHIHVTHTNLFHTQTHKNTSYNFKNPQYKI